MNKNLTVYTLVKISLPLALLFLAGCTNLFPRPDLAEVVYINGVIYTVDQKQPWIDSVAIKEGKFIAAGARNEIDKFIGNKTDIVDLQGQFVLPGMHDAHTHIELVANQRKVWCYIPTDASPDIFISTLKNCNLNLGNDDWLLASAYSPGMFPNAQIDRSYLDRYFPDRPIYIVEHSWHHGMGNSKALEIAGINDNTPDPVEGKIIRDKDGRATGELVEKAAWLVKQHIPATPSKEFRKAIKWIIAMHNRYGITSVQDAETTAHALKEFKALDESEGLSLRIAAHIIWDHPGFAGASNEVMEDLIENRADYSSQRIDPNFVKIIVDGSPMEPHSNHADLDPKTDEIPADKLLISPDRLKAALIRFDKMGIKVKMHCVGTAAARAGLDAIEAARRTNGDSGIYHEIAHSVWYSEKDLPRVAQLNAVAEMSPAIWHHGWPGMEDAFEFQELDNNGTLITAGTDWVILPNPNLIPALEGMLTRERHSIDLESGIEILTINGAKSIGKEESFGSIEVGKSADMVVLDRNLFQIPVDQISEAQVVMTIFEGKPVFTAR
jgi:predicted amidohydrolase YtcJ